MYAIELFKLYRLHLLIGLVLLWLLLCMWQRRHLYLFASKFPGFWGWPIVGAGLPIINFNNFLPFLARGFKTCKRSTYGTWLGIRYTIVTQDPEFARQILVNPDKWGNAISDQMTDIFGENILAIHVPKWQPLRKMLTPAFQQKVLNNLFPNFNANARSAVAQFTQLEGQSAVKFSKLLHDVVAENSMSSILGGTTGTGGAMDTKTYFDAISYFMETAPDILQLDYVNLLWTTNFNIEFQQKKKYIQKFMSKHLTARLKANQALNQVLSQKNNNKDDETVMDKSIFVDLILKLYQEKQLSWPQLISNANSMMAASIETTASAIFSTITLLAMHPEVQQNVYEEISVLYPDDEIDIKFEDLTALPYLDMVVNESQRLLPPLPVIGRKCYGDTELTEGQIVPKDVQVLIPVYHLHRNKDYWGPNAEKFDPTNFLPEQVSQRHPFAFIPFAKGLRNCLGWRHAMFTIKIFLIHLIHQYRFTTKLKFEHIKVTSHAVLHFVNEPTFEVQRRQRPKAYLISM